MADSPASSDLSDPPSVDSDAEDRLSTPAPPSSRPSVDIAHNEADQPPSKRRKTAQSSLATFEAATPHPEEDDESFSVSSDGYSSAPGSPNDDEWSIREQAQTQCLWRDCAFGTAENNDDLVKHVQSTHCATGGPKKTKYVCEWGECQRKTSNHPSGYALKAHMRSHTKEKPYYCQLPECDKAFTRSDALAKHMRTVHEPEPVRGTDSAVPVTGKGKALKVKSNGGTKSALVQDTGPTHDEDGNWVNPSPPNDNITYIPAHHPITGQPGFMIHYPPDIHFTAWESSITADQLMRLLRRQVHWAQKEAEELKKQVEALEQQKREEWQLKEILLEGTLEAELAHADQDQMMSNVDMRVKEAMAQDVEPSKLLKWTKGEPKWRTRPNILQHVENEPDTDAPKKDRGSNSPSPPPTAASGGFDGEADPFDNYLAAQMSRYEERERMRSAQSTPAKLQQQQQQQQGVGDA